MMTINNFEGGCESSSITKTVCVVKDELRVIGSKINLGDVEVEC